MSLSRWIFAVMVTVFVSKALAIYSWERIGARDNLYVIRDQEILEGRDIQRTNQYLIQELNSYKPPARQNRTSTISQRQAQRVLDFTIKHPVVGSAARGQYDPSCVLGFCFGRALFTHLELLRRGVDKAAIKKAFVVGPMDPATVNWQFHVATLVKGQKAGTWYALDTFMGSAVPLEAWYAEMNKLSTDHKLRLFVTEPAKLGPSAWEYNLAPFGLYDPIYNDYFKNMFAEFKRRPVRSAEQFHNSCQRAFSWY